MKTADLCRRQVITARPDMPLADVSRLMRTEHVGSVVVVDAALPRRVLGIVTDRDIVVEVVAAGLDPRTVTAGEVMSISPAVTRDSDDALWALKTMRDRGVRRLPVVDAAGALVGIVALDDMMEHIGTAVGDIARLIGTERAQEGIRRA